MSYTYIFNKHLVNKGRIMWRLRLLTSLQFVLCVTIFTLLSFDVDLEKESFLTQPRHNPKAIVIGRLSGDWVAMLLQSAEGMYQKINYIVWKHFP